MTAALYLIIIAFGFYLRIKPRLKNPYYGTDAWYFLLAVEKFREQRALPFRVPYYVLDEDEQYYPPGFFVLLGSLPQKFLKKFFWLVSPAIDTVQIPVLMLFTGWLTASQPAALLAGALYAFTPTVIEEGFSLNSRGAGSVLLTLTALSLFMWIRTGSVFYLVISVCAGVLVVFTHKMTTQAMIVLLPVLSAVYRDPRFLYLLLCILVITAVIAGKYYYGILRRHMEIILFWKKNLYNRVAHPVYDSPVYGEEKIWKKKTYFKDLIKIDLKMPLRIISPDPFLVFGLLMPLFAAPSAGVWFFWWWSFIVFIWAMLTLFVPGLQIFGEWYKYLKLIAFPGALVSACMLVPQANNVSPAVLVIFAVFFLIAANRVIMSYRWDEKNKNQSIGKPLFKILDFLKDSPADGVACLPYYLADAVAYFCRKKVLWGSHSSGWDMLEECYPVFRSPVEKIAEKYNMNFLLLETGYVKPSDIGFENMQPVLKEGTYLLYKLR